MVKENKGLNLSPLGYNYAENEMVAEITISPAHAPCDLFCIRISVDSDVRFLNAEDSRCNGSFHRF